MSNLQYLSQTNLAMIGRDMQLLSYNQLINNVDELADGLHDLIALVSQINTKTAVNNSGLKSEAYNSACQKW